MPKVEKMRFETYLAVIQNSVGTKLFSEGYARIDGQPTNIMAGGEVACAFFVSGVLCLFDVELIDHAHATVTSTVKDLEKHGWEQVNDPQAGDIIVWEPVKFPDGKAHEHIGFVVSKNEAISNDYASGAPQRHGLDTMADGQPRKITAIYRGRHLFESPS